MLPFASVRNGAALLQRAFPAGGGTEPAFRHARDPVAGP